jgi:hypothetical protein
MLLSGRTSTLTGNQKPGEQSGVSVFSFALLCVLSVTFLNYGCIYRDGQDQRHWEQQQQHQVKRSLAPAPSLAVELLLVLNMRNSKLKRQADGRPCSSTWKF